MLPLQLATQLYTVYLYYILMDSSPANTTIQTTMLLKHTLHQKTHWFSYVNYRKITNLNEILYNIVDAMPILYVAQIILPVN